MTGAIEVCVQKTTKDCGIAALAMLSGKPYQEVFTEAHKVVPRASQRGLWTTQLLRIARKIGYPLRKVPFRARPEDATGLLTIRKTKGEYYEHVVVVFQGVIIDPNEGLVWDEDAFLTNGSWAVNGFLTPKE